jgi:hypothetical protein
MGSCHSNHPVTLQKLIQELSPFYHTDSGSAGCLHFHIIVRHGGRAHDEIGARHILCPVTDKHACPAILERLHGWRSLTV